MRGEEDFFSVARTMPFVAKGPSVNQQERTKLLGREEYL